LNGFPNKDELLKSFFLADSINPLAFMANYFEVCGSWPSESPAEVGAPTPSAVAFQKGLDAPTGYPRWFLAAYPDVALWVASRDDNTMLRVVAEALYGAEDAKGLIRSHGEERAGKLIDEKLRDLDLSQLRRLVTIYRRDNRNRLECSI